MALVLLFVDLSCVPSVVGPGAVVVTGAETVIASAREGREAGSDLRADANALFFSCADDCSGGGAANTAIDALAFRPFVFVGFVFDGPGVELAPLAIRERWKRCSCSSVIVMMLATSSAWRVDRSGLG